jgi:hypothetical protein
MYLTCSGQLHMHARHIASTPAPLLRLRFDRDTVRGVRVTAKPIPAKGGFGCGGCIDRRQ